MRKRFREYPEEPEHQEEEFLFPIPIGGGIENPEEFFAELERQIDLDRSLEQLSSRSEGKEEKKIPLENGGYSMPRSLFSSTAKFNLPSKQETKSLPLLKNYQTSCREEDLKKILNILAQHEELEHATEIVKGILFDPFICSDKHLAEEFSPEKKWALVNKIEEALIGSPYSIDWNDILHTFKSELDAAEIFSPGIVSENKDEEGITNHTKNLSVLMLYVLRHIRKLNWQQRQRDHVEVDQKIFSKTSPQLLAALAFFLNQLIVAGFKSRISPEGREAKKNVELFLELAMLPNFFYKILAPFQFIVADDVGSRIDGAQVDYLRRLKFLSHALERFIRTQELTEPQEKNFTTTSDMLNSFVYHVEQELAKLAKRTKT